MYDIQKASMWKRISAGLFDFIVLAIAVIGLAYLLTTALNYDSHTAKLEASYDKYSEQYGVDLDISSQQYEQLEEDEKTRFDNALEALTTDKEVNYTYTMLINLTLIIITFSILLAYLLLEFLVPLLFGNGQTLGKKIFGIGVMREDGVKLSPLLLFARTVLGKYTVETMIPVLTVVMIFFGFMGLLGTVIIGALLLVELFMIAMTKCNTPIHDKLAHTVTVDMASQMIFDTPEALLEYKKKLHAQDAEKSEY